LFFSTTPVFSFHWFGHPCDLHSFPTRRSSDLTMQNLFVCRSFFLGHKTSVPMTARPAEVALSVIIDRALKHTSTGWPTPRRSRSVRPELYPPSHTILHLQPT